MKTVKTALMCIIVIAAVTWALPVRASDERGISPLNQAFRGYITDQDADKLRSLGDAGRIYDGAQELNEYLPRISSSVMKSYDSAGFIDGLEGLIFTEHTDPEHVPPEMVGKLDLKELARAFLLSDAVANLYEIKEPPSFVGAKISSGPIPATPFGAILPMTKIYRTVSFSQACKVDGQTLPIFGGRVIIRFLVVEERKELSLAAQQPSLSLEPSIVQRTLLENKEQRIVAKNRYLGLQRSIAQLPHMEWFPKPIRNETLPYRSIVGVSGRIYDCSDIPWPPAIEPNDVSKMLILENPSDLSVMMQNVKQQEDPPQVSGVDGSDDEGGGILAVLLSLGDALEPSETESASAPRLVLYPSGGSWQLVYLRLPSGAVGQPSALIDAMTGAIKKTWQNARFDKGDPRYEMGIFHDINKKTGAMILRPQIVGYYRNDPQETKTGFDYVTRVDTVDTVDEWTPVDLESQSLNDPLIEGLDSSSLSALKNLDGIFRETMHWWREKFGWISPSNESDEIISIVLDAPLVAGKAHIASTSQESVDDCFCTSTLTRFSFPSAYEIHPDLFRHEFAHNVFQKLIFGSNTLTTRGVIYGDPDFFEQSALTEAFADFFGTIWDGNSCYEVKLRETPQNNLFRFSDDTIVGTPETTASRQANDFHAYSAIFSSAMWEIASCVFGDGRSEGCDAPAQWDSSCGTATKLDPAISDRASRFIFRFLQSGWLKPQHGYQMAAIQMRNFAAKEYGSNGWQTGEIERIFERHGIRIARPPIVKAKQPRGIIHTSMPEFRWVLEERWDEHRSQRTLEDILPELEFRIDLVASEGKDHDWIVKGNDPSIEFINNEVVFAPLSGETNLQPGFYNWTVSIIQQTDITAGGSLDYQTEPSELTFQVEPEPKWVMMWPLISEGERVFRWTSKELGPLEKGELLHLVVPHPFRQIGALKDQLGETLSCGIGIVQEPTQIRVMIGEGEGEVLLSSARVGTGAELTPPILENLKGLNFHDEITLLEPGESDKFFQYDSSNPDNVFLLKIKSLGDTTNLKLGVGVKGPSSVLEYPLTLTCSLGGQTGHQTGYIMRLASIEGKGGVSPIDLVIEDNRKIWHYKPIETNQNGTFDKQHPLATNHPGDFNYVVNVKDACGQTTECRGAWNVTEEDFENLTPAGSGSGGGKEKDDCERNTANRFNGTADQVDEWALTFECQSLCADKCDCSSCKDTHDDERRWRFCQTGNSGNLGNPECFCYCLGACLKEIRSCAETCDMIWDLNEMPPCLRRCDTPQTGSWCW